MCHFHLSFHHVCLDSSDSESDTSRWNFNHCNATRITHQNQQCVKSKPINSGQVLKRYMCNFIGWFFTALTLHYTALHYTKPQATASTVKSTQRNRTGTPVGAHVIMSARHSLPRADCECCKWWMVVLKQLQWNLYKSNTHWDKQPGKDVSSNNVRS